MKLLLRPSERELDPRLEDVRIVISSRSIAVDHDVVDLGGQIRIEMPVQPEGVIVLGAAIHGSILQVNRAVASCNFQGAPLTGRRVEVVRRGHAGEYTFFHIVATTFGSRDDVTCLDIVAGERRIAIEIGVHVLTQIFTLETPGTGNQGQLRPVGEGVVDPVESPRVDQVIRNVGFRTSPNLEGRSAGGVLVRGLVHATGSQMQGVAVVPERITTAGRHAPGLVIGGVGAGVFTKDRAGDLPIVTVAVDTEPNPVARSEGHDREGIFHHQPRVGAHDFPQTEGRGELSQGETGRFPARVADVGGFDLRTVVSEVHGQVVRPNPAHLSLGGEQYPTEFGTIRQVGSIVAEVGGIDVDTTSEGEGILPIGRFDREAALVERDLVVGFVRMPSTRQHETGGYGNCHKS